MQVGTYFTRKKIAAFGMGFFGMFWIGGSLTLALYETIHRMVYGRFPDMDMGMLAGRGAFVFAHTSGEPALLRHMAARLLETDVLVGVLAVPFACMLASMAVYGWKALARDFAGLRTSGREEDDLAKKGRTEAFRASPSPSRPPRTAPGRPDRAAFPVREKPDGRAA